MKTTNTPVCLKNSTASVKKMVEGGSKDVEKVLASSPELKGFHEEFSSVKQSLTKMQKQTPQDRMLVAFPCMKESAEAHYKAAPASVKTPPKSTGQN